MIEVRTYMDALPCLGRHQEHECREEGQDDGRPYKHVNVIDARPLHVNRVHDGGITL